MELTYAKTMEDLKEIADKMGKVFSRGSYFTFYKTRMDYQTLDPYFKPEHSRIIKENGEIVSHVSIIEKYVRIEKSVVKMAGIGDVYTLPDYRGKNYSRILMDDAIKYMEENDYPISMLYGIPNYYHKFGYIEVVTNYASFIPTKNTKDVMPTLKIRPYKNSDLEKINELYNEEYKRKTGSIKRVTKSWYKIANPQNTIVVVDNSDTPLGYMTMNTPYGGYTYYPEVVAPNQEIKDTLMAEAVRMASEQVNPEIEFRIAPDNSFYEYLQNFGPKNTSKKFKEGEGQGMLKIVNTVRLFEEIKGELQERINNSKIFNYSGILNLLTDAGDVSFIFENGKLKIKNYKKNNGVSIQTKQNYLVRSVVGFWNVESFLLRSGIDELDKQEIEILNVLFPMDYFFTCEGDYF